MSQDNTAIIIIIVNCLSNRLNCYTWADPEGGYRGSGPPWNCQIISFCHVEIFRQTPSGKLFSGSAHVVNDFVGAPPFPIFITKFGVSAFIKCKKQICTTFRSVIRA